MDNGRINGLDLFSGIGGIACALETWVRTVAYCEQDKYAQAVLLSAMQRGDLDVAPIWDDVRTLRREHLDVPIDIITGGFPCQDISTAGNGIGLEGKRSGLFFEIVRLCRDLRPRFVFLENVPAITVRGLDRVLMEFTSMGYDCRWTIVSAAEVGAPHIRERWWLLAHSNCQRRGVEQISRELESTADSVNDGKEKHLAYSNCARELQQAGSKQDSGNGVSFSSEALANSDGIGSIQRGLSCGTQKKESEPIECRQNVADADCNGFQEQDQKKTWSAGSTDNASWWASEPNVGRVANGIPARVDRIRCLGNAVVPHAAREAFERLLGVSA